MHGCVPSLFDLLISKTTPGKGWHTSECVSQRDRLKKSPCPPKRSIEMIQSVQEEWSSGTPAWLTLQRNTAMSSATRHPETPHSRNQHSAVNAEMPDIRALVDQIRTIITNGTPRAIRIKGVCELTGGSRSQIFNQLDPKSPAYDQDFPKPFRLGKSANSPSVWWEHEIVAWMQRKAQSRISNGVTLN